MAKHAAKALLRAAQEKGWTMRVQYDDEVDYDGPSAKDAWVAVEATEAAWVSFFDAAGNKVGAAFLMAPGPGTCQPDESIVDYTIKNPEFVKLCDGII
jgi:hypothetical protein